VSDNQYPGGWDSAVKLTRRAHLAESLASVLGQFRCKGSDRSRASQGHHSEPSTSRI